MLILLLFFLIIGSFGEATENGANLELENGEFSDEGGNGTFFEDEYPPIYYLKNLTKDILGDDYEKEVSPFTISHIAEEDENPIPWNYTIFVPQLKLIDVDEPKEQMTVIMELVQHWKDERLIWDPEKYGKITELTTRLEKIWSLPFTAFGASEVVEHRDQNYRTAQVWHNGDVFVLIPLKMTTNCKMNMRDFPFDTQICEVRVGLPLHGPHRFEIGVYLPEYVVNSCTLGNSAWDIFNISYGQEVILSGDSNFDNNKLGVIKLHLKRNPMFYMYMIVLPTFIINAISIAGVFMKNTEKMDRLTVGLTHIMTMTFILALIADKLPKTEKIPLLGKYIIFGLCTMIVAMTFSTYLKKISKYFSEKLEKTRSAFGQKLRRFIGSPLRVICIIIFQAINLFAGLYLLYRLICFEQKYDDKKCYRAEPVMEIIPERFANGTLKEA
ncbi:unnamed protein product [Caenorhabditis angaria]|uniref:Neurotransmitter-gated ion-channel ligand-binding domain-containing protein n=1 Tax=Caenorhabditis angaria TaxID=860376 RepID=A0A9P1I7K5_9PELO|nr:unnamed protein product [Caenorhabditis angaria]